MVDSGCNSELMDNGFTSALCVERGYRHIRDLTKSHKTKSRKLQLACFWTNFMNKTLLGLFLVVPRESWDRSVVIVLLASCSTLKVSRVLLALGYLLASFASSAMGFVLHKDLTLTNTTTPAVLAAQMNLTLSHYNECPRLYNILFSFWRYATILPQRNHFLAKPSIWNCGTGFL